MAEFVLFDKDSKTHKDALLRLLIDYFAELFRDDPENSVPPGRMTVVLDNMIKDMSGVFCRIYFCRVNNEIIGFIEAQIDAEGQSWCKRPGWGLIMETYIVPSCRNKGCGSEMCLFAESVLAGKGVKNIYLTAGENNAFWKKAGYTETDETDSFLGQKIYVKEVQKNA